MKKTALKTAFRDTLPVMTGYLFLGIGFGVLMHRNGYGVWWSVLMGLFVYAGSAQYLVADLLANKTPVISVAISVLLLNARHLFYGISMLEKYRDVGKGKPYLIFGLTDETYSLVCTDPVGIAPHERRDYYLLVTLLNHIYWVGGSVLGAVAGTVLQFNSEGIDFALTALFLVVFLEQWLSAEKHGPALIGVGVSVVSLLLFGADSFLIPSMVGIGILLAVYREEAAA